MELKDNIPSGYPLFVLYSIFIIRVQLKYNIKAKATGKANIVLPYIPALSGGDFSAMSAKAYYNS